PDLMHAIKKLHRGTIRNHAPSIEYSTRLIVGQNRVGNDDFAAAALMFQPSCGTDRGTEIVEHPTRPHPDAGARMQTASLRARLNFVTLSSPGSIRSTSSASAGQSRTPE